MPAFFFKNSSGDIFGQGGGAQIVSIPFVDEIVGDGGLALYSSASFQVNETVQYFLAFDDVIKFIHFGKAVGAVNVEGVLYCDCTGDLPGLSKATAAIGSLRGEDLPLTLGGYTVTGILTSATITAMADQDTFGQFSFSFAVVNHS